MRPSKGCMTFFGGAATGVVVASALGFVVVRYVLLATIQVPVVSLNEWGTQPLYRRTGETPVVMTEPFRRWFPGTATFRADVEVSLLESRERVEFYVVPDYRAPVPFIIDTGAEWNFLSWDTLSLLGVPEHVPAGGWFTAPRLHAASAEVETKFFILDRLGLGPHVLHDPLFAMVPTTGRQRRLAGLGSKTFSHVALDLDLVDRVLRINPTDAIPSGAPFVLDIPVPTVQARFGALEVVALIDTGATHTAISPGLRERLQLVEGTVSRVTDGTGLAKDVPNVQLPAFELAGVAFFSQEASVLSVAPLALAVGELYLIVGMSALNGHRVVIDYPKRTVSVVADATGESSD
ncbi:MAG: aspartyl protease family protein [Deltaproteobacteria bacterium]|nr:aspartyl protease family protein [Deltaproteobacteria bacterium]